MATSAPRSISSGNGKRLAGARSASNAPSRRRSHSKTPSPGELIKRVAELEEANRNQENTKKQEAKRRQKDLASAKKLIGKEIRSAQQALRKSEQEVGKLTQQAARMDQRSELECTKKMRQLKKFEEDMQKQQSKRNMLSEATQKKVATVGEARGKLAHMQLTASLLELGVVTISDATKKAAVDIESQKSLCALGNPDPQLNSTQQIHEKSHYTSHNQIVETGLQQVQSLPVDRSEAVSADSTSAIIPETEDSLTITPCSVDRMSSTKVRSLDGSVIAFVHARDAVKDPAEANETPDVTPDAKLLDSSLDKDIDTTSTCISEKPESFASFFKPRTSTLEHGSSAHMIGHQASRAEFSERPVSAILSMQAAPSNVEDTTSKSISAAFTCDGAWAYPDAKPQQNHEFVTVSSCRIQNAAYHRPAYEPTCEPTCKPTLPSTKLSRADDHLVQKGHHGISMTAPCRLVVRQTSVETRAPAMTIAPDMMRYTRSASVLPPGARYSNALAAMPRLRSSPTQPAIPASRLPASPAILYEPVAAPPPFMASPKVCG